MSGGLPAFRVALGASGLVLMGVGGYALLADPHFRAPFDLAVWLAGAVAVHDALIAPLVLAVGVLLARVPSRGVLRAGLVAGGCLTLVALPVLLRPGTPNNPSVLPLDYPGNWLIALGVTFAGTAAVLLLRFLLLGRHRRAHRS